MVIQWPVNNRLLNPDVFEWVIGGYIGGYIADPLASAPVIKSPLADLAPGLAREKPGYWLEIEMLQLDPRWTLVRPRSLLEATEARKPFVVFTRDTQMQDTGDADITLAHELFHALLNSGAHVEV